MFTSLQVFDDGDERTLRRTSLCLKGGRHFNESEVSIKFIFQHVYFGVASLMRNWTRTWFSLQYIVFILFLDPWPSSPYRSWKFWYPSCAGKQYLTNPVWHVLSMLYLFFILSQLVHSPASNVATASMSAPLLGNASLLLHVPSFGLTLTRLATFPDIPNGFTNWSHEIDFSSCMECQ